MAADETTLDLGIGPEMIEGLEMLSKLEGITDITAMDGPLLTFGGRLVTTLDSGKPASRAWMCSSARVAGISFSCRSSRRTGLLPATISKVLSPIFPTPRCASEVRAALRRAGLLASNAGTD